MNTPLRKRSAFVAWAASLPVALVIPAIVWMILCRHESGALWVTAISIAVHFVCCLLTGLPIFLIKFKSPDSGIWTLSVALPVGGLLGAGVAFFILTPLDSPSPSEILTACLTCAGYGVATAIAAWLQRPIHPTP